MRRSNRRISAAWEPAAVGRSPQSPARPHRWLFPSGATREIRARDVGWRRRRHFQRLIVYVGRSHYLGRCTVESSPAQRHRRLRIHGEENIPGCRRRVGETSRKEGADTRVTGGNHQRILRAVCPSGAARGAIRAVGNGNQARRRHGRCQCGRGGIL